ncbi:MAG: CpXC domain-containing protein [Anaerolineae bacterium]
MQTQTTIQCSACGQPIPATVYSMMDVTQNPQAKAMLLSGRLNVARCPNCGTDNQIATPLLYHDATKELLIAHVPMALNMTKDQQEKAIGDLMKHLPKENFKAYMFNPRRALTMQGMIDQVLEADGITPEMMEAQRERVRLAQSFVEADDDTLLQLIAQHDDQIDMQFLQTITLMAQRAIEAGQQQVAESIVATQNIIVANSSYGQELLQRQSMQQQVVQEVAEDIQNMGVQAQREDFLTLAVRYADDEDRLQALVGLARPAFDYDFFQLMTLKIGQAPADQRDTLTNLRDTLLDLTAAVDQQSQAALQNAAGFLQALLNDPQPEALLAANLQMLDDTFMAVLDANIEHAERQANVQATARLKQIRDLVIRVLQSSMQPELRFVNDLLSVETDAEAEALLRAHAAEYGPELLEVMQAIEEILIAQGEQDLLNRLRHLQAAAQTVLNS